MASVRSRKYTLAEEISAKTSRIHYVMYQVMRSVKTTMMIMLTIKIMEFLSLKLSENKENCGQFV
jgi:hypothetical protein